MYLSIQKQKKTSQKFKLSTKVLKNLTRILHKETKWLSTQYQMEGIKEQINLVESPAWTTNTYFIKQKQDNPPPHPLLKERDVDWLCPLIMVITVLGTCGILFLPLQRTGSFASHN